MIDTMKEELRAVLSGFTIGGFEAGKRGEEMDKKWEVEIDEQTDRLMKLLVGEKGGYIKTMTKASERLCCCDWDPCRCNLKNPS